MIILVDGKKAMLKHGFSFDYVAENRLFLGRDGYTLSIAFPLKDCPQNMAIFGHIHRLDVDKKLLSFECAIIDSHVSLLGTLSIVKLSANEVECQFSEGRCEQVAIDPFEDVLISELDLGSAPTLSPHDVTPAEAWGGATGNKEEVALPWINESSPTVPNNWVYMRGENFAWDNEVKRLSWQPYLIVIAKRICDAIGYSYDFSSWESSYMRLLIICNTLPESWDMPQYARALPGWTVSEFFEKLELFLMCEFDFDHREKSVRMRFSKDAIKDIAPVHIEQLVDEYTAELSHADDARCDYIASKRLAYKECSHSMWNFYSCDWYVQNCRTVKKYETLRELINKNGVETFWGWMGEPMGDGYGDNFRTPNALLYAEDADTYFVFRNIGTKKKTSGSLSINCKISVLQPVNVFGSGSVEDETSDTEEIEFVPACIMDTYVSENDDKGYMMFLSPSGYDEQSSETEYDEQVAAVPDYELSQPGPAAAIAKGQKEKTSNYYDEIYVAFWDNFMVQSGKTPYPEIDNVRVTQDWVVSISDFYSMRLTGGRSSLHAPQLRVQLPQIDATQKFKFSWLSDNIPNPRAIFHIKGKRYLCEKITATFTENGMSQLLKGEFYPLLDED